MKLNKITLTNIASYEGTHEFDFTITNPDQNIILIGGQNGAGKTSLFKAIQLALYGPLYFNYQGAHHIYLLKIKEFINDRTFTQEHVNACIKINFDITEGRDVSTYDLQRSWTYIDQKIEESLVIYKNNQQLDEEEINFFQNYIQTVLPPHLFDFFFFDGEELASFFLSSKSNSYIKDALLTLCDFDTFEHIRKYSKNYIRRNQNDDALDQVQRTYDHHLTRIISTENTIVSIENELELITEQLKTLEADRFNLEQSFKTAGGLSNEEKENLNNELNHHEQIKAQESYKQRSFFDEMLPFILVKEQIAAIKNQLEQEAEVEQYNIIKDKLSDTFIHSIVKKQILKPDSLLDSSEDQKAELLANTLYHQIHEELKPPFSLDDFTLVHDISKEQKISIERLIHQVEQFDSESILDSIEQKNISQQITADINTKLRSSMPDEDVERYIQDLHNLTQEHLELNHRKTSLETSLETERKNLDEHTREKERLLETLRSNAQDKNIYDITTTLSEMLNTFIIDVSQSKFDELKKEFLYMFGKIIRKDHFVDDIEIDDQFEIHLYRKKIYSLNDLRHLLKNVGLKEFIKQLGHLSMEKLMKKFSIEKENQLEQSLYQALFNEELNLFEKVKIQQFSKGEKQIYILSLYWAMIKVSTHEIPFVIDTPYARIDTEHRDHISTIFFPNISHQVIILSTNEEINEYYYKKIKPYVAKEYLLDYDKENNRTEVRNKYFFEVTS